MSAEGGGEDRLTHLDESGAARMVDVSAKPETERRAVAEARLRMSPRTAVSPAHVNSLWSGGKSAADRFSRSASDSSAMW